MQFELRNQKRLKRCIAGAAVLLALTLIWNQVSALKSLENPTLDFRYQNFNRTRRASSQVVYVDIDEASMKNLSPSLGRWPWPRRVYKDLIEFLSVGEPAGIFFDVYFTEPEANEANDHLLAEATGAPDRSPVVSHAMNLIVDSAQGLDTQTELPADFSTRFPIQVAGAVPATLMQQRYRDFLLPNPILYSKVLHLHATTFEKDGDGIFRSAKPLFRYGGAWVPSLSLAAAQAQLKATSARFDEHGLSLMRGTQDAVTLPLDSESRLPIHYYRLDRGPERLPLDVVLASAARLQKGDVSDPAQLKVNPLEFQGKVIIVGGSAAGLEDLKATPVSPSYPGALLHATLVSNILEKDFLTQVPEWVSRLAAVALALVCYIVILFASNLLLRALVPLVAFAGYNAAAISLFYSAGVHLEMARPAVFMLLAVLDGLAFITLIEGAEKKRMKSALIKYVSPALAESMIASGIDPRAEVGRTEELSILFSDIRGFTTLSEKHTPAFLVGWLNEYFAKMTRIVFDSNGTLDKFIGDALMCFWGAPARQEDHAVRAVSSGLAMTRALTELLKEWDTKYDGKVKISTGIGVHSGEVVVGNIGSDMRLEYTVIGDNVNLASRIEGLTKQYRVGFLVSERTKALAGDRFIYRKVDCVQVKGKTSGVHLYEPLAERGLTSAEVQKSLEEKSKRFSEALAFYEQGDFVSAKREFLKFLAQFPDDGPCQVMMERCEDLIETPPPSWNGIYVAKDK